VTNPASQTSVGESFNAVGGCTNYCQTFKVTATNYILQTISIYAGVGTGTGAATNIILRLFDLGNQTAPNPSAYTPGTDLFNSGNGLAIAYSPQTAGVLEFDFSGSDQVTLLAQHMYGFEVDGVLNTSPMLWQRTTNDAYSGGAAYRNRSWINATNARDFALAVYVLVNGTNTTQSGPDGIVVHAFAQPSNGVNQDGANPAAGLLPLGGVLCGTTLNGGLQGAGTAFNLSPDGSNFNVLRTFANTPDAGNPQGDLASSGSRFLGTSFGGGSNGVGTVFVGQTNGSVSVIRNFATVSADRATNSGGASPTALLALAGNTVFGTATAGGAFANGTVFSLNTNGSAFTVLHDFTALDSVTGTNADGALPWGGLFVSGNTLYGTASVGGTGGSGVVFSIDTNGNNFVTLRSFTPMDALTATNTDGAIPFGGLVLSNNTLYGTTTAGGQNGRGTIFSIQTNGLGFIVLHQFAAIDPVTGTNADGTAPCAVLTMSSNALYGTASAGGAGGSGTIYSVKLDGTQFKTLHSFAAMNSLNGTNADGALPVAGLLLLGNSLYGTTFSGGPGSVGTVFSLPIPNPPASITNIVLNPNGSVTLFFLGVPNTTNIIQVTGDLVPPVTWRDVSTNVADVAGAWQFTETATNSTRFYRSYAL
jgi:uncharacterized repeat protein (TIGR03803 family)